MEEDSKKGNSKWAIIIVLPLIWGIIGLIKGKGFFPYIAENIKALLILGLGLLALLGLLTILDNKK
jgi:Na+/H+ antiporter NhaC